MARARRPFKVGGAPARDARRDARGSRWVHGMHPGATAGPTLNGRRARIGAIGGVLSLVAFFARAKKATLGAGRSIPQLHAAKRLESLSFD